MSLISVEIKELREMNKQLISGSIKPEDCSLRLKVYKATAERERMILDMHKLSTLKGLTMKSFSENGLFNTQEVLPVIFADEDIACPDLDRTISREECLDYSGSAEHNVDCRSCPNYGPTRQLLMPQNK